MWNAPLPRPRVDHLPPTLASRISKAEQVETSRVARRMAADMGVSPERLVAHYAPTAARITLEQERQDEIPDDALAFVAAERNELATIKQLNDQAVCAARDLTEEPDDPATCMPLARIGPGGSYVRDVHTPDAAQSVPEAAGNAGGYLATLILSPFRWIGRFFSSSK